MYYLYILQSEIDFGYYIGITSNLEERLKEHNSGKTKSIKHRKPFKIIYTESFSNKTEARKREIFLKKKLSRKKKNIKFNRVKY